MTKKKILIIEDDKRSQKLIADYLSMHGYEVLAASDGHTAVDMAEKHSPNVIILDLRLPGRNGFVVLKLLREMEACAETPIIVTSAFDDYANRMQAYKSGANYFMAKPIDIAELRAVVDNNIRTGNDIP